MPFVCLCRLQIKYLVPFSFLFILAYNQHATAAAS